MPLGEPGLEVGEGAGGIAGEGGAGLGDLVLEAVHVEQAARRGQHVAGPLPPQQAGVAEGAAQQGHVALEGVDGRRRRSSSPHVVDESVDGDDLPGDERQARQHGALAGTAQ